MNSMLQCRCGCLCHHILEPAVTLTFDLQHLIRSAVGCSEYSLSVLLTLLKPFMRYRGNNIQPNKRMGQLNTVGWWNRNYGVCRVQTQYTCTIYSRLQQMSQKNNCNYMAGNFCLIIWLRLETTATTKTHNNNNRSNFCYTQNHMLSRDKIIINEFTK